MQVINLTNQSYHENSDSQITYKGLVQVICHSSFLPIFCCVHLELASIRGSTSQGQNNMLWRNGSRKSCFCLFLGLEDHL